MVYGKSSKQKKIQKLMISLGCVILSAVVMAVNIKSFVRAGDLFPGGFTGLTVLIQRICQEYFHFEISYTLVNVILNAVPAVIGYKTIGKKFTFYSLLMVVLSGIFVDIFPNISITSDTLLVSVFGGIINGFAISIALHGKASSGGTDFIAVYLSNKFNGSSWGTVFVLNAVMLTVAGLLFGWEAALYSIIFQFVSTNIINYVHKEYSKVTLNVFTSQPNVLIKPLMKFTHHAVTRFEGVGCYSGKPKTMLYVVVGKDEVKEIVQFIRQYDDKAFINILKSDGLDGRFYHEPME